MSSKKSDKVESRPAKGKGNEVQRQAVGSEEEEVREGWFGWLSGWVVVPLTVLGAIFVGGVYLGANHPDNWYTKAIAWIVDF